MTLPQKLIDMLRPAEEPHRHKCRICKEHWKCWNRNCAWGDGKTCVCPICWEAFVHA